MLRHPAFWIVAALLLAYAIWGMVNQGQNPLVILLAMASVGLFLWGMAWGVWETIKMVGGWFRRS